ncbi:putative reverse transcriptase domain-containing protein [Tanacetum coccineum]
MAFRVSDLCASFALVLVQISLIEPVRLQDAIRIANSLMDQKLKGYAAKSVENKKEGLISTRKTISAQTTPYKRQIVGGQECSKSLNGLVTIKKGKDGHLARIVIAAVTTTYSRIPEAKSKGGGDANPDFNVVTGMFLLNNLYASMLFDSGYDRSFVSTTFSALLDVISSTLHISYHVELANGRVAETNIVLIGCTLELLGHPFNIDLIHVELGSFDVIIGMNWLANHHAVIVCYEKIVRIPYGDEVLIVQGDRSVTKKETEDKLEEKRLQDVPKVRDFLEVFLEDLPGLPPTQQVEFQIDLVLYKKEHEEHLKLILRLLKKEELYAMFSKCEFLLSKIHQFLSLAGYDRRFIECFSKIAKPMTKLTQKNVKFNWGEKAEAAFQLNVVADALSQKERIKPLRVRALVMTIGLNLPKQILNAQAEARKEENYITEYLCGMIKKLEPRADGTLCLKNRI